MLSPGRMIASSGFAACTRAIAWATAAVPSPASPTTANRNTSRDGSEMTGAAAKAGHARRRKVQSRTHAARKALDAPRKVTGVSPHRRGLRSRGARRAGERPRRRSLSDPAAARLGRAHRAPDIRRVNRSEDLIVIEITLNQGRTLEIKKALYADIVARLGRALDVRPDDVLISLIEVTKENWSFGNGLATYG